jgi:threonyl-tRNA synthetase
MPNITLPDGNQMELAPGSSALDLAKSISNSLAKRVLAANVDDVVRDINFVFESDSTVRLLTFDDPEGLEVFRHSSAHLMAEAVVSLFPNARPTIGPVVEEGFYYDFDHEPFSEEDLEKIEKRMAEIVKQGRPLKRLELTRAETLDRFSDNKYKVEMIEALPEDEIISVYEQGETFSDLCRGPHVPNLSYIKSFKLLKVAGAYWRGDSKNQMLQRIYGISFDKPKQLKIHLNMLEEARKRDHRKLGKELDLFSFHEEGQGFPFWHNKGSIIYNALVDFIRMECTKRDYTEVRTPIILNQELWLRSGHWDHYADGMYFTDIDEKPHAVKPMNCPGGMLVYKTNLHSYRDLPIRQSELGMVHRNELSGVLHGLFRVRAFTQDDAHIFCTMDQIHDEVIKLVEFCTWVYDLFGFQKPEIKISTQPEKHIGEQEDWDRATQSLIDSLESLGIDYGIDEGDGAFYGPKIDFDIRDSLNRRWQCGTVQVDFQMPERFDLQYEGPDGKPHRPVILHRTILGSVERFIGILIEHTAAKLPLWISPVQARVLPVTDGHNEFAEKVRRQLIDGGIRAEVDVRSESLGKKIRAAQLEQINYILVVGDKEVESGGVNVRTRDNQVHGLRTVDDLLADLQEEIRARKLPE